MMASRKKLGGLLSLPQCSVCGGHRKTKLRARCRPLLRTWAAMKAARATQTCSRVACEPALDLKTSLQQQLMKNAWKDWRPTETRFCSRVFQVKLRWKAGRANLYWRYLRVQRTSAACHARRQSRARTLRPKRTWQAVEMHERALSVCHGDVDRCAVQPQEPASAGKKRFPFMHFQNFLDSWPRAKNVL